MGKTVGDLAPLIVGLGETVPLLMNGEAVENVALTRNTAGDLELHFTGVAATAGTVAPAAGQSFTDGATSPNRENDLSTLTDEEREALRQTEKLGGVEERRSDPDALDEEADKDDDRDPL